MNEKANQSTYVVWVEFEDEFSDFLDKKCNELRKAGISLGIQPPHMTLTFINTEDEQRLIKYTEAFMKEKALSVFIECVDSFPSGVTFYMPAADEELLCFQRGFCEQVSVFSEPAWELYYPENWTPHIALTSELNESLCGKALEIMSRGFEKKTVKVKKTVIRKYGKTIAEINLKYNIV